METLQLAESLKEILEEERDLLDFFVDEEEKLRLFVARKDWVGVDTSLRELQGLADDVAEKEAVRQSCYKDLCILMNHSTSETFYRVMADLSNAHLRREMNNLFRSIKVSLLRLKGVTTGLGMFVADKEKTIQEVLEEIVPQSRGTTYGRDGNRRQSISADVKLLNQHF